MTCLKLLLLAIFQFLPFALQAQVLLTSDHTGVITCIRGAHGNVVAGKIKNGQLKSLGKAARSLRSQRANGTLSSRGAMKLRHIQHATQTCRAASKRTSLTTNKLREFSNQREFIGLLRASSRLGWYPHGRTTDSGPLLNKDTSGGNASFSSTYVAVAGVDEADFLKYDGEHLYLAQTGDNGQENAGIRILRTKPELATAEDSASITFPYPASSSRGLYLSNHEGKKLLTSIFDDQYTPYAALKVPFATSPSGKVHVAVHDVSSPDKANEQFHVVIDGSLLGSRRIGDRLLLLTQYYPKPFTSLDPAPESASQLLPAIKLDGQKSEDLARFDRCLREDAPLTVAPDRIVSITVLNLTNKVWDSRCILSAANTIHATDSALYLLEDSWHSEETQIHKFALDSRGLEYRASGRVPGTLDFMAERQFMMNDYEGFFRIFTTTNPTSSKQISLTTSAQIKNRLTVLKENAEKHTLEEVAHLPNETRPNSIGKEYEHIYSVRFSGKRAYVVTFLKTDPFYVIDLRDPADPLVAGQLKLPGYSSLLHPVSENLVLGIGKDATESGSENFAWFDGLKLELFDVSNPQDPRSLTSLKIGKRGTTSSVLYDYHALTLLADSKNNSVRFALPIELHDGATSPSEPGSPPTYFPWVHSGLHLFEIGAANGQDSMNLREIGSLITQSASENHSYPPYSSYERALIHGPAVFYAEGATTVTGALWPTAN